MFNEILINNMWVFFHQYGFNNSREKNKSISKYSLKDQLSRFGSYVLIRFRFERGFEFNLNNERTNRFLQQVIQLCGR